MDENVCDVESDVLLPPRKRLLAGFKRLHSDSDAPTVVSPPPIALVAASSSSASLSSPPASPSPSSVEFQTRLNNLLNSHFTKTQNMTPDQIVEASRSAADSATKAAQAARTAAQEKATIAAMAVTAAKDALALVAQFSDEGSAVSASKERNLKKNKTKKHVQVQLLYKKHQPVETFGKDEELARKLHRGMNSSPRTSKRHRNEDFDRGLTTLSISSEDTDSEDSVHKSLRDEKGSKPEGFPATRTAICSGESEPVKVGGALSSPSKKRGRLKLKKLPLSICNFRDQANPKEDTIPRGLPLTDKNAKSPTGAARLRPLFPLEPSGMEAAPIWKCQDLKAPTSVKQSKVMQS